jgi:hypothetical protein
MTKAEHATVPPSRWMQRYRLQVRLVAQLFRCAVPLLVIPWGFPAPIGQRVAPWRGSCGSRRETLSCPDDPR